MTMAWAIVAVASAALAVVCFVGSVVYVRRAEHAAQRLGTATDMTRQHVSESRQLLQQVRGLTKAYADAPAPVVPQRLCPIDGAPLAGYEATLGKPAVFTHQDGTMHPDLTAQMTAQTLPDPAPLPDPRPDAQPIPYGTPEQVPAPPSSMATVNAYMQRADTAAAAGLFDPDGLRTGVAGITRNPEFTQAMQDIADRVHSAEQPPEPELPRRQPGRMMPDPTRAVRVRDAGPHVPGPTPRNGDGS